MEIICPECQFSRQVDETKIPARSQVATCPKCQTKFKFRELPEEMAAPEEPVTPQGTEEQSADNGPRQASLLDHTPESSVTETTAPEPVNEPEPVFPKMTAPGEDPKEELWDKLGGMTPPEKNETPEPEVQQQSLGEQEPVPGWTGEFNNDFPDPMQGEEEPEQEEATMQVPPPFEQLDRYGFFHGLYMTIKLILLSPRLFFSVMPVGGGLAKPLTFTILVSMVQSLSQYVWGLAGLSVSGAPEEATVGGMTGSAAALLMLLFLPAFIAAGQFVITGIYHLLLILMRGDNKGFEGTFRALAYANAPMILGIFPMPIPEIEMGWLFVTALWGLFLTITGLRHIHKTSYAKVIPVAIIPLLLGMIAAMSLYQTLPTI